MWKTHKWVQQQKYISSVKRASKTTPNRASEIKRKKQERKHNLLRFQLPDVRVTHMNHMKTLTTNGDQDQLSIYSRNYMMWQHHQASTILAESEAVKQENERELMKTEDTSSFNLTEQQRNRQQQPKHESINQYFKLTPEGRLKRIEKMYNEYFHRVVLNATHLLDAESMPSTSEETHKDHDKQPTKQANTKCVTEGCQGRVITDHKTGDLVCADCGICFRGQHAYKRSYTEIQHSERTPAPYERIAHVSFVLCF